jgi:hypothetical protein
MKVCAIKCFNCGDIIFSRAHHDYRECSCRKIAIDGGRLYTRIIGNIEDFKILSLDIKETNKELYDDWDKNINKFGLIKE